MYRQLMFRMELILLPPPFFFLIFISMYNNIMLDQMFLFLVKMLELCSWIKIFSMLALIKC